MDRVSRSIMLPEDLVEVAGIIIDVQAQLFSPAAWYIRFRSPFASSADGSTSLSLSFSLYVSATRRAQIGLSFSEGSHTIAAPQAGHRRHFFPWSFFLDHSFFFHFVSKHPPRQNCLAKLDFSPEPERESPTASITAKLHTERALLHPLYSAYSATPIISYNRHATPLHRLWHHKITS